MKKETMEGMKSVKAKKDAVVDAVKVEVAELKKETAARTEEAMNAMPEVKKTVDEVKKSAEEVKKSAKRGVKKAVKAAEKTAEKLQETVKDATKVVKTEKAEKKETARTKRGGLSKNLKEKLVVQIGGQEFDLSAVMKRAEQAAVKKSEKQVKTLEVYVKPEEQAVYYVVNGEGGDDFRVDL